MCKLIYKGLAHSSWLLVRAICDGKCGPLLRNRATSGLCIRENCTTIYEALHTWVPVLESDVVETVVKRRTYSHPRKTGMA